MAYEDDDSPRRQHSRDLHAAFARAERGQRELQRLKALYPQWPGLHFHPEQLGPASDAARSLEIAASAAA